MATQRCTQGKTFQCTLSMYHEGNHIFDLEQYAEKTRYLCPKCNNPGLPSVYGDYCTRCSNSERGFS